MKSHFTFTKQRRNGILWLLLISVAIQSMYFFLDFSSKEAVFHNEKALAFQKEIDSLKLAKTIISKPKIYPFNPNYITDFKGYSLGMTNEETDRLLEFRAQNKWVNSAKQFQEVTQVSDSLLAVLEPYFKFPDWVTNPQPKTTYTNSYTNTPKTFEQKQDLNTATQSQLQRVNGIGDALSKRIVTYRTKIGGFIADVQLQEVYGLTPEVIERINNQFTVKTPKQIKKINLNTATSEELVTIHYIDYEIAHRIIEQRILREGFKSLDELTKVKDFPVNKIEIIKLYLTLN